MDWLTFWSNVITAFAWPLTTLAVLIVVLQSLPKLRPFITRLKYGDFELEFDKRAQEAAEQAEVVLAPPTPPDEAAAAQDRHPEPAASQNLPIHDQQSVLDQNDLRVMQSQRGEEWRRRRAHLSPGGDFASLERYAMISPKIAITKAWKNVEWAAWTAVLSTGRISDETMARSSSITFLDLLLRDLDILDTVQYDLWRSLRQLHETVDHVHADSSPPIGTAAAINFVTAAGKLTDWLSLWKPK